MDGREAFRHHLKPRLYEQLQAIGLDVVYERGHGDYLYYTDEQGQAVQVLDLLGGFGAGLFGHNHPELLARARAVLDAGRPFNAQASVRALAGELAARLSARVGRSTGRSYRVTLANSGTEAIEAAVKHAEMEAARRNDARLGRLRETLKRVRIGLRDGSVRVPPGLLERGARLIGVPRLDSLDDLFLRVLRRAFDAGETEPRFLAVEGAFHGKTTGSLMLTYNPDYRSAWGRIGLRTAFLPIGDEAALTAELERSRVEWVDLDLRDGELQVELRSFVNVSGFFVEPIQGEGGIRELPTGYLAALRRAADEAGFPLIIDEIQTGMGRTGTFLASEPSGVRGDYYLLSKALGGGLAKISALLVDEARSLHEFGYLHTSTFADDDFASAVALGALELVDRDGLLERCRDKGEYLLLRLRALRARYPAELKDVRGRGLMIGIELTPQLDAPSALLRVLSEQNLLGFFASGYLLHEHRIRVAPTLSAQGTIRIEPSAFIEVEELDRFCEALEALLLGIREGKLFQLTRFLVGRRDDPAPAPARPPRAKVATAHNAGRVAFLAHFLKPTDLRHWDPALGAFDEADCRRFLDRTSSVLDPFPVDELEVRSATGDRVRASVLGIGFLPEQVMTSLREGKSEWALELVRRAVEMARELGCTVVGFGGYTSIVSDNCRAIVEDELALTSGNSLTAAAALEALFAAARQRGLARARLGVVGAAGNIGAVLAEVAADEVDEIVLCGRRGAQARLEAVARVLGERTRVSITTEMEALRECPLIISATNAPRPVIQPAHVGRGPVILCDVAAPRDVDPAVRRERPDALVLAGGIVKLPLGQRIEVGGMDLPPGQIYGCLAETLLLGLGRERDHLSYGRLTAESLRHMRELARRHGFTVEELPASD